MFSKYLWNGLQDYERNGYMTLTLLLATEEYNVCGCTKDVVRFYTYLRAYQEAQPWHIACIPSIWNKNKKNYKKTIHFHSFCEETPMHSCEKYVLWLSSKLIPKPPYS